MSKSKAKEEHKFTYPVEKGIPVPPYGRGFYPFAVMDVGDCFTFPTDKFSAIKSALATFYKSHGRAKKFTVRRELSGIVQNKKVGRIWRIE